MPSVLLVTSKSNLHNARLLRYDDLKIVPSRLTAIPPEQSDYKIVYALGGGGVIDTAKIMAGRKQCVAFPTTASGAGCTSWAVVWKKNKKLSIQTPKPILCQTVKLLKIDLPARVLESTYYDCLAHILDSRASRNRTPESLAYCDIADIFIKKFDKSKNVKELIEAGNYAGHAIEITGTNFLHALSYVLTLDYGLDHGMALKEAILMRPKYDWSKIISKAKWYEKFNERLPCAKQNTGTAPSPPTSSTRDTLSS